MLIVTALLGFVVGVIATPAVAAAADKAEKQFKKLDANGDGKLSVEEFVGKKTGKKADRAKKRFAKLDKNSDNSLSLEEFKARKKKKK